MKLFHWLNSLLGMCTLKHSWAKWGNWNRVQLHGDERFYRGRRFVQVRYRSCEVCGAMQREEKP